MKTENTTTKAITPERKKEVIQQLELIKNEFEQADENFIYALLEENDFVMGCNCSNHFRTFTACEILKLK